MRIDGTGRSGSVGRTRGTAKSERSGSAFSVSEDARSDGAAETTAPGPIGGIDALLALQSVEGPGPRGARVKHGHDMLDLLDELKLSLLAGEVPPGKLESLVSTLSKRPDRHDDERLEDVLDEIELRARVELAKLGREAP